MDLGSGPCGPGGRTLADLVMEWERETGAAAAVLVADDATGRARMGDRTVELWTAVQILQWLTRTDVGRHPARPLLLLRANTGPMVARHVAVDDATGRIDLDDSAESAEPDGRGRSTTLGDLATILVAAVLPRAVAPDDYGREKPRAPQEAMPWNIYDPRILEYAAPPGLPVEVLWRQLFDQTMTPWMCLLNADALEDVTRIPYRQSLAPPQLLEAVRTVLRAGGGFIDGKSRPAALSLGVDTGRGGHVVSALFSYDGRVGFIDPWGGRSLLCEENNTLGIKAARDHDITHPGYWTITEEEFLRVARFAMVPSFAWARANGIEQHVGLADALRAFGTTTAELPPEPFREDATLRGFTITGRTGDAQLRCITDSSGLVRWTDLRLSTRLLSPSHSVDGGLLVANLLEAFTPPADRTEMHPLSQALAITSAAAAATGPTPAAADAGRRTLAEGAPHLTGMLANGFDAILGSSPGALVPLFLTSLIVSRESAEDLVVVELLTGFGRLEPQRWRLPPRAEAAR